MIFPNPATYDTATLEQQIKMARASAFLSGEPARAEFTAWADAGEAELEQRRADEKECELAEFEGVVF